MTTSSEPEQTGGLRALDPDLPFLAAEVAIDVDNLLAGRSEDRSSMQRLAGILSRSFDIDSSSAPPRSRMDIAAYSILSEAVTQSIKAETFKKMDDLLLKAIQVAKVLDKGDPQTDKAELEQAGNFCVALSKAAAAYRESIHNLHPTGVNQSYRSVQ